MRRPLVPGEPLPSDSIRRSAKRFSQVVSEWPGSFARAQPLPIPGNVATGASDPARLDRLHSASRIYFPNRPRLRPDALSAFSGEKFLSAPRDRARAPAAGREARNNRSCGEALAAGTMRDCVRVRDFEPALLEILAVIQQRSADEKRALGVDHYPDIGRFYENVAIRRAIVQVHFVLQSRATAANDG